MTEDVVVTGAREDVEVETEEVVVDVVVDVEAEEVVVELETMLK